MIQTLPITKAREELTTLVDNVKKKFDEYIITVNGTPAAVLMSVFEYDSWKETNKILADPKLIRGIKQGEADMKAGKVYRWEEVKKELGLQTPNNVSHKTNRSSKKRT